MKTKILLTTLLAATVVGSVALGEINIKVGDPVSQIFATLGNPSGTATMNGLTCYTYDGGIIVTKEGKVVGFPSNYEAVAQRTKVKNEAARLEKIKQEKFTATQQAKGLIFYENQWMTPGQKTNLEAEARQHAADKVAKQEIQKHAEDVAVAVANKKAQEQVFLQGGLRYKDIVLSPQEYFGNELTLRGGFYYRATEQREFDIKQGDYKIRVCYKLLPKEQQAEILAQKNFSHASVEVKGTLRHVYDADFYEEDDYFRRYYYIQATSVSFYESR